MIYYILIAPNWLLGMVFGAMVAGLASVIVAAMARFGFKTVRRAAIMPIIMAATVVGSSHIGGFLQRQLLTPEIAGRLLKDQSPEFIDLLETEFPQDYASMMQQMTELMASGATIDDLVQQSASVTQELRHKYAPMVRLASDADQAALLDTQIRTYQAVLDADPEKCPAFATAGPSALAAWVQKGPIMDSFNDQALSLFRAIAGAKRMPTYRRDSTDDDFRQIIALMLAHGATTAQLGALTSPQPDSPDLCPAMIMMMKTMNEDDSEGVKAVRAQFLADMAAG